MSPALAVAWAEAQPVDNPQTHDVLLVLARNNCDCALSQIAGGAQVPAAEVEAHVRDLVQAGLLVLAGDRLELNFDAEMAARHLRRNRLSVGPGAPIAVPVAAPPAAVPEPAPAPVPQKRAKPPAAPPAPPTRFFAAAGSPEKRAWDRTRPGRGYPDCATGPDGRTRGWWFETQWPEGTEQRGAA
jgi:hypothetical protein